MKYIKEFYEFIIEASILTTDEFKRICKAKYDNLYDYKHVKVTGLNTSIRILCKKHGPFNVTPAEHMRGIGCPDCSAKDVPGKIASSTGYDVLTSDTHRSQRAHYAKKPFTTPFTSRKPGSA